jgi:L-aminopeptidase/D-esterase-like protein
LARWFTENGNGEMTGTTWVEESGFLEGPVMITNTHSVGIVRDAVIGWRLKHRGPDKEGYAWSLPIVAIPKAFFATNPMEEPISSRILTTKTGSPASAAGGHRFWVSPEVERMYYPYNTPVAVSLRNGRKP